MDEDKKPSMLVAVLLTVAVVCSLMTFVLMATGGKEALLTIFQLFTAGLMTFCAILNWVVYFRKYVSFEVKKQLGEKNKE